MFGKKNIFSLFAVLILLSSCSPINRFTRLKRTPREYSINFCGEEIKAPRTRYNKESWIVFSDRANNPSYRNPGGKVQMKEMEFMEPFFVIKEKGEFLRLVKYDPAIVGGNLNTRIIKDRKQAQYYGWVHKSRLLLTRQSPTDIATGFKNKAVSIVTDTTALMHPDAFFSDDSIRIFKDLSLTVSNGKIPFHEIIYKLKTSSDGEKVLVGRKMIVSPDSAGTDVLGWIHSSLVKEVGQRLYVDVKCLPHDTLIDPSSSDTAVVLHSLLFKDKQKNDTLSVSPWALDESFYFSTRNPAFRYSPVLSYCMPDSGVVSFKTGLPTQVIDKGNNYVFNVNGNKIMYDRFKELEKELRRLNIVFVFEGKERVIQNYSEAINIIQNLQPLFEQEDDPFRYRFGAVMAFQPEENSNSFPEIKSVGLTGSYPEMMEFLTVETEQIKNYKPLLPQYTWSGVRKAVEMVEPHSEETNVMIILGETGYSEWADSLLVERIAAANCRILGYQIHNMESNAGNNFVLQVGHMIEHYAQRQSVSKREKIVYSKHVKPYSRFRESVKNIYALDFPKGSMSQGWILFPEKSQTLPMNILSASIDTLIMEVKSDNDTLIADLYNAFNTVGNHRFRYDSLWVKYNDIDSTRLMQRELPHKFKKELPAWYLQSQPITLTEDINKDLKYHLLLSKEELDELMFFLQNLSSNEPDYKYRGKKKKAKKRCNCPDDDEPEFFEPETDSSGNPEYMNTRKIRSALQRAYMTELKNCRLCKINNKVLKSLSLGEAQRRIIGSPGHTPLLYQFLVGDIKDKKVMSDKELDELIQYFKLKKENLERHMMGPKTAKFESNGQSYYWIDRHLLP